MKQQDEDEEEEEDKEEVLSQSLQKRDKNIKENKAMVMNHCNFLKFSPYSVILCDRPLHCQTSYDSGPLCCCLSVG